jgi:uncharacterized protein (TIGR02246 family)
MKLRVLTSLLLLGVWAGTASAQPTAADIQKIVDEYTAAWAKGDAKGVAGLFTESAVRVEPTGVVLLGRAQIQAQFEKNFAGPWKGSKLVVTPGRTTAVTADVAVNEGKYEVTGLTDAAGKPTSASGHYVNTTQRQGGRWMIASNTTFQPVPPPPAR